jgi:hypothetical protein
MFNCDICKKAVGPRKLPTKVVTKTREATYPARDYAHPHALTEEAAHDPGGRGTEIVEEKNVCQDCLPN